MLEAGLILSRLVHYASVLLLFGAGLFPLYCFGTTQSDPQPNVRLKRLLLTSAVLALFSWIGWFLFSAATMSGDAAAMVDTSLLFVIVTTMTFGKLWIARLGLIVLLLATLLRWPGRVDRWLVPLLAALLVVSLAATGHAQEPEIAGWHWHVLADSAHLLAAGAWLGALWPLVFALGEAEHNQTGALLLRFSVMGQFAITILLLSGFVNSWFLVGSVSQLATTSYGRLLSIKMVLFLMMLILAAANRFWITPQFVRPLATADNARWLARLRRHVVAEQALGLLILAVVSLLGTLQPRTLG